MTEQVKKRVRIEQDPVYLKKFIGYHAGNKRKIMKYTHKKLGKMIGASAKQIDVIERGTYDIPKDVPLNILRKLACALNSVEVMNIVTMLSVALLDSGHIVDDLIVECNGECRGGGITWCIYRDPVVPRWGWQLAYIAQRRSED